MTLGHVLRDLKVVDESSDSSVVALIRAAKRLEYADREELFYVLSDTKRSHRMLKRSIGKTL